MVFQAPPEEARDKTFEAQKNGAARNLSKDRGVEDDFPNSIR